MKTKSQEWAERLRAVIPCGSGTMSKVMRFPPDEPGVIVKGRGCRVWDADGREFIDYRNALGPVTLGYQFPATNEAIIRQLETGIIFGHPHPLEGEVAEMIRDCVPCAERVRFLKTGGEAIAACIRLARYRTGRDHVVQIGYNGWLNSLATGSRVLPGMIAESTPPGVPSSLCSLHHAVEWHDIESIEKWFSEFGDKIAAFVVAAHYAKMAQGKTFYPFLRELTRKHGTVLIFDEIVTGFRIAIGGVQEYFRVKPDLAVFAKGIANGMPLSVYCGKAEIMDTLDKAIVSSTYAGETLSLAAAKAAITTYKEQNVIGHLWKKGEKLVNGLNALFKQYHMPMEIAGFPPCPIIAYASGTPKDLAERFFRATYRNGVSLYNVIYVNFSHQDADIAETLERVENGLKEL